MQTFPKLQRSIPYKTYIVDLLLAFVLALISSSYIYFPLLIGLVITANVRLSFSLPFLFFIEISHSFVFLSLIIFFIIYTQYIYPVLEIVLKKEYANFLSIVLVYLLYFASLSSYSTINDTEFNINIIFIIYYILVEQLLFVLKVFE